MTYFDCFWLVGRLKFHICADKTSYRQYFFGDMTRLQVSFSSIIFLRLRQPVTKILRQLYKANFIRVFSQKT